jgi:hypothetical protein
MGWVHRSEKLTQKGGGCYLATPNQLAAGLQNTIIQTFHPFLAEGAIIPDILNVRSPS